MDNPFWFFNVISKHWLYVTRHYLKQLVENVQTRVCHVSHGVLECPDDGVEDELELRRRDREEGSEAVVVDRLQHDEKVGPVFRELFEILRENMDLINAKVIKSSTTSRNKV